MENYRVLYFQEAFTCVRGDEKNFDCTDSERFYELNRILGLKEETNDDAINNDLAQTSIDYNVKSNVGNKLNLNVNNDINQRIDLSESTTIDSIRYELPTAYRNPIVRSSTTTTEENLKPYNFITATNDVGKVTTTFSPNFEDATTKIFSTPPQSTEFDSFEYTTNNNFDIGSKRKPIYTRFPVRGYSTDRSETTNTRIIPDLYEIGFNNNNHKITDHSDAADQVIESIKQLQKNFPNIDDASRSKRFLLRNDNRHKYFDKLHQ